MTALETELKTLIIEALNLEGVKPEDIGDDEGLFGDGGLALDSIDALEIGVALQKKYGIKIDPEDDKLNEHFRSVRALATYIAAAR
jgi:acyl carrier protein